MQYLLYFGITTFTEVKAFLVLLPPPRYLDTSVFFHLLQSLTKTCLQECSASPLINTHQAALTPPAARQGK